MSGGVSCVDVTVFRVIVIVHFAQRCFQSVVARLKDNFLEKKVL